MSIVDVINILREDKNDIAQAITNKGVVVPTGSGYDDFAGLIAQIPSGGSSDLGADITVQSPEVSNPWSFNMRYSTWTYYINPNDVLRYDLREGDSHIMDMRPYSVYVSTGDLISGMSGVSSINAIRIVNDTMWDDGPFVLTMGYGDHGMVIPNGTTIMPGVTYQATESWNWESYNIYSANFSGGVYVLVIWGLTTLAEGLTYKFKFIPII